MDCARFSWKTYLHAFSIRLLRAYALQVIITEGEYLARFGLVILLVSAPTASRGKTLSSNRAWSGWGEGAFIRANIHAIVGLKTSIVYPL